MAGWKEFKEHNVSSGLGTALCIMLPSETKYHILCATASLPSFAGEPNTIEYSTTTNRNITYIAGKNSTNNIEISIPYNLDNIAKCKKIKDVKCKYAYVDLDNFSAGEFTATARYRIADTDAENVKTIIINLTVNSWNEDIVEDVYDIYQDTIIFNDDIPEVVRIASGSSETIKVVVEPSSATITATPSGEGVATASYSDNKLSISATAKGTVMVSLVATDDEYASNERHIKVIVE